MNKTPNEKAIELIKFFSAQLPYYTRKDNIRKSKLCALKLVDEILGLNLLKPQLNIHILNGDKPNIIRLEYWFEVKEYINKYD